MKHDFTNVEVPDDGSDHVWHGYPDETFAFTSFVDSLVALVLYGGWGIQPPITTVRMALVVDFVSNEQREAELSIRRRWSGTWEYPMGVANSYHRRVKVNVQNKNISRQLSVIGTEMTAQDFDHAVVNRLVDLQEGKEARIWPALSKNRLGDVFQILAIGTKQPQVHLFANWTPSEDMLESLNADGGISIVTHSLGEIPSRDLDANRHYHVWEGTEQQGHEFREAIWAPGWMTDSDKPLKSKIRRQRDVEQNLMFGEVEDMAPP